MSFGTRTCGYMKKVTSAEEKRFKDKLLKKGRGDAAAILLAASMGHPEGKHLCVKKVDLPRSAVDKINKKKGYTSKAKPPPLKPAEIDKLYREACKHECRYCEESFR